jgi:transcriptional regulator with XRE-family HTH domain
MAMGHPLRAFRSRQSPPLTQKQLGDILGVRRETVARWETEAQKIDAELLPLVSERTGITPSELRPDLARLMREVAR